MSPAEPLWSANWAWSLPLIVLTVLIHVLGLGFFNDRIIPSLGGLVARTHRTMAFIAPAESSLAGGGSIDTSKLELKKEVRLAARRASFARNGTPRAMEVSRARESPAARRASRRSRRATRSATA